MLTKTQSTTMDSITIKLTTFTNPKNKLIIDTRSKRSSVRVHSVWSSDASTTNAKKL